MKLYTTEQVYEIMAEAFSEGVLHGRNPNYKDFSYDNFLKVVTPISLPSDDEIINASNFYKYKINQTFFQEGAEWVIDKIKNQQ